MTMETETGVKSGNANSHQKLEEAKNAFFPRVFADVPRLRILRGDHPGLSRWALNSKTSVLVRDRRGDTGTQRGPCEEGGRD